MMENELPYANLNDAQLKKLKRLENELREVRDEEIVLLAYRSPETAEGQSTREV